MIIIGHQLVPFEPLFYVQSIDDVKKTKPNAHVLLAFYNTELLLYVKNNSVTYSLLVQNLEEVCLANALGASNILIKDLALARVAQNTANEYLFDAKILFVAQSDTDIELVAQNFIDGIIINSAIIISN